MVEAPIERTYKICLLGATGVGKTSLARRFVQDRFDEKYRSTIGVNIGKKVVDIDNRKILLMIWDAEGIDAYNPKPRTSYLHGADGYLLVIDGTRKRTLYDAKNLNQKIQEIVERVAFRIALNKFDLENQWELTDNDIEDLNKEGLKLQGLTNEKVLFKTSAAKKENNNVEETFFALAKQIYETKEGFSKNTHPG